MMSQLALFEDVASAPSRHSDPGALLDELRAFTWEDKKTRAESATFESEGRSVSVPLLVNEFWTSRQRAAHSLHEISYRACFKPQLPRFFIERLTQPGDVVYDPFMGRGTTVLESALLGRTAIGNDINPLSRVLIQPRLQPPSLEAVRARLARVDWTTKTATPEELLTFYHPDTLREICALQRHLREADPNDTVAAWIRMVAVNRLTGHSPGFFSVYTLPPNQAASVAAQRKINASRQQVPPRRDVPALILRKSRSLLASGGLDGARPASVHRLCTAPASATPELPSSSVDLVVTSPPFLDVVNYASDNWLRCWFCEIDAAKVPITIAKQPKDWQRAMRSVFDELHRVVRPAGFVAFEVGEVRRGELRLEELAIPAAMGAGFEVCLVLVNVQEFTKTANCWGVTNNERGTNTNRIVIARRVSH